MSLRPLSDLQHQDRARFGAKAVNLARLGRAGLAVPSGFAIALAPGAVLDSTLAAAVRGAIDDEVAYAVRSSAVGEDSADASFAGQFETLLDVRGPDAVLAAIATCAASVASARAQAYGEQRGAEAGAMAVIVQTLVPADFAGVCFTRSPATPDHVAIDWIPGLGEDLVSGRARAAHAEFDRQGLQRKELDDPQGWLASLGEARLHEVARGSLAAEEAFGVALDVEWAITDGDLWFLQARPITASPAGQLEAIRREEIARLSALADEPTLWTDFSIGDTLPNPSPLLMDCFRRGATREGALGKVARTLGLPYVDTPRSIEIFDAIGGKAFINLTRYVRTGAGAFPFALRLRPGSNLDEASEADFPATLALRWPGWPEVLHTPAALLALAWTVPRRVFRVRRALARDYRERIHPALTLEAAHERTRDLRQLDLVQLWELFDRYARRLNQEQAHAHLLCDFLSGLCEGIFKAFLARLYGDEAEDMAYRLSTGLPGNFNTDANLALADVAFERRAFDEVLDVYGHRGWPDWDLASPRWRESEPRLRRIVEQIAGAAEDPRLRYQRQVDTRREAERRFRDDVQRHPLLRHMASACRRELQYFQAYTPLRELTQAGCYLWVELARRVVVEAARRLNAGDLLFFLTMDELRQALTQPDAADWLKHARAMRERTRLARTLYVPHVLDSSDLEAIGRPPRLPESASTLKGFGISPGVVRGKVRVAQQLSQAADLQPGEILVVEYTDPAWTPLFFVAGGLILEQGSRLSHGAIVAREVGLPALINVPHATRVLRTGQEVVLDAVAGQVFVVD